MADLIDRDAALAEIGEFQIRFNETGDSHERVAYASAEHCKLVIKAAPAVNRWISCSERLPEQDGEYLVFTEYEDVFKCTFDSNEESKWGFEQDYRDPDTLGWVGTTWTAVETVTHWQNLPEPPEKE